MKEQKKSFPTRLLCVMLLFMAFLIAPVSADTTELSDISSITVDRISINSLIDSVGPNANVAEDFLASPTYWFVFDCLMNHDSLEKIDSAILSQILYDFPYSLPTGTVVVRDISIETLLSEMDTNFAGHGWTGQYIKCMVADPMRNSDLENAYKFIQYIAKRDGFEEIIPLIFVESFPPIVVDLERNPINISSSGTMLESNDNITRAKDDKFRPIIGGIKALSPGSGSFTLGFSVKFSSGYYGVISCGHGNQEGTVIYQPDDSSSGNAAGIVSKQYLNGVDASLITLANTVQSKGSFNGQPWNLIGEIKDVDDYGMYDTSKLFRLSGITSGNVDDLEYDSVVPYIPIADHDSEIIGYINNALVLRGTADFGDSGAPVYQNYDGILPNWNNKLIGIVSAIAAGTDGSGNDINYVFVQPIMPILNQLSNDGYSLSVLLNGNT